MLTKILHWIDDKLLGEYIVLAIICIIVLIGGFWLYKADNQQKSDRYYIDEKGIQREVKFVKINNYLYYDDYTKAVYYQKSSAKAACMVQYVGKHLRPCKYINGRVVEQKINRRKKSCHIQYTNKNIRSFFVHIVENEPHIRFMIT